MSWRGLAMARTGYSIPGRDELSALQTACQNVRELDLQTECLTVGRVDWYALIQAIYLVLEVTGDFLEAFAERLGRQSLQRFPDGHALVLRTSTLPAHHCPIRVRSSDRPGRS